MFSRCDWWLQCRQSDPEPAMYPRCSHWFLGHLAPSGIRHAIASTGSFRFRNANQMWSTSILVQTFFRQKGPIIPVGLLRSWSTLLLPWERVFLFVKLPTMRWKMWLLLPGLVPVLLLGLPIRRTIVQQALSLGARASVPSRYTASTLQGNG